MTSRTQKEKNCCRGLLLFGLNKLLCGYHTIGAKRIQLWDGIRSLVKALAMVHFIATKTREKFLLQFKIEPGSMQQQDSRAIVTGDITTFHKILSVFLHDGIIIGQVHQICK
ncbi:hypothetical protein FKM82_010988 [Ascaphus truei]